MLKETRSRDQTTTATIGLHGNSRFAQLTIHRCLFLFWTLREDREFWYPTSSRANRHPRALFRVINEARQSGRQVYRIVSSRETGNVLLSESFDIHRVRRRPSLCLETSKRSRQVNGILAIMQQSDADNLRLGVDASFSRFSSSNCNCHVYLTDVKRDLKVTAIWFSLALCKREHH